MKAEHDTENALRLYTAHTHARGENRKTPYVCVCACVRAHMSH